MNETTLKTVQPNAAPAPATTSNFMFDLNAMEKIESFAQVMAKGNCTIPKHLQKNPADCMAIVIQSLAWNMIPHAVAQKTHVINGTLGYEAQLVNSVINAMAPTRDRLHFEWYGPWKTLVKTRKTEDEIDCGVRVWATIKGEDSPRILEVEMSQATVRNSPLWKSDPKQQLAYLATKKWARLFCPDVIMGVYTPEDLSERPIRDITPEGNSVESLLESKSTVEAVPATIDDRIEHFLESISAAQNMNRLKAIGQQVKAAEEDIQAAVRHAYADKLEEFRPKPEPETVDTETGEIATAPVPEIIEKIIAGADSIETLIEVDTMLAGFDKRTAAYQDLKGKVDVRRSEIEG